MLGKNTKIETKQQLSVWLLWSPLKFAFTAFGSMLVLFLIYSFIMPLVLKGESLHASLELLVAIWLFALVIAAILMIRNLPRENLDRYSFIALNNAQMFLLSGLFITFSLIIAPYAQTIMAKAFLFDIRFMMIAIFVMLLYLYLFGLFFSNLYAKFRRVRAMGISSGKAICSLPFAFALLWIPGYIVPEQKVETPVLQLNEKWYRNLTNQIASYPLTTAVILICLIAFSGFFFGFNLTLLTLILSVVFAVWAKIQGNEKFRKNISKNYANFAVTLNVILIILAIGLAIFGPASRIIDTQIGNINTLTQTEKTP